jgi:hypothetical protein
MALVALAGCSAEEQVARTHVVRQRPPSRKDVIEAVLASQSIRLAVDSSCMGVGTEAADSTIGGYLSGFLAELDRGDMNWLETNVAEAQADGIAVWRAELTIRHQDPQDEWGWGVRFDVRQDTGAVDPESFLCIGAG